MADVGAQVALTFADDFQGFADLTPREQHQAMLAKVLDDLVTWSQALTNHRATVDP